jgi:two-component system NarL family response regulator
MASALRVLLVEDDELFRLGLRIGLQQELALEIVAEATDGETAVKLANECQLDVVLLDVGLPGIGGVEACRRIKQAQPKLPVLILTSRFQKSLIAELIAAGAQGYCLKGVEVKVLGLALQSVVAGASWWDQAGTQQIRASMQSNSMSVINHEDVTTPSTSLTKREREILQLLALGKSNREIAEDLSITLGTVRIHVHAILQKLDVRDRTQAVIVALQNKLVTKL